MSKFKFNWKNFKTYFEKHLTKIALIASALAIIPFISQSLKWLNNLSNIELPGTYQNETWKHATTEQFKWLEGEWFYPSLRGYKTRFKVIDDKLYRQNQIGTSDEFTNWIETEVFISNREVLRIHHESNEELPHSFIYAASKKQLDFWEYERYVGDDGNITSGDKRLALNFNRCKIFDDGIIYDCK